VKLKTTLPLRRNAGSPRIELNGETYTANEKGIYEVPDAVGDYLIDTGNFDPIDPKAAAKAAARREEKAKQAAEAATTGVLVNDDGEKVDLNAMSRDEIVGFALELGLDFLDSTKSKEELIAEIMATVKAE
jgi:hypothetical protein